MITYQQLCEKRENYQEALIERQRNLQRQIKLLATELENNLGLTGKTYHTEFNSHAKKEYVNILSLYSDEPCNPFQLEVNFNAQGKPSIAFRLELVLEKAKNTYPKYPVSVELIATICNDNELQIDFNQMETKPSFIVVLNKTNCFAEVIEAYKQIIMECFSL